MGTLTRSILYIHIWSYTYIYVLIRLPMQSSIWYIHTAELYLIHTYSPILYIHWSKEPPPPGGGSYLLCSLIKNPEEEDPPQSTCFKEIEGGPLPPGSGSGNIVNRIPPRGVGFLSINLLIMTHWPTWLNDRYMNTRLTYRPTDRS